MDSFSVFFSLLRHISPLFHVTSFRVLMFQHKERAIKSRCDMKRTSRLLVQQRGHSMPPPLFFCIVLCNKSNTLWQIFLLFFVSAAVLIFMMTVFRASPAVIAHSFQTLIKIIKRNNSKNKKRME